MEYFGITFKELIKAHILDVHLPNVLIGIASSVELPIITILGRRVGATHSQIAEYVLISSLCRTLLDIPFGVIVEYCGVRNVMLACLLLNALAAIVGLCIDNAATLLLYCVLTGSSLGGFFLSRHIFVAGIASKKYRGMLMSLLSGLLRWSHVIGPAATGLITAATNDLRYAFVVPLVAVILAFVSLSMSGSSWCRHPQSRSRSSSMFSSLLHTPLPSDEDETATAQSRCDVSHPVRVVGEEDLPSLRLPAVPPGVHGPSQLDDSVTSVAESVQQSMAAGEPHHFHISTLWYTIVDHWSVIWRLGLYIVLFGGIRANRKLMIAFAGLRENLSDADVSYLLSFGFAFDAVLFPLGGIVMDRLGRQFAMVPVAVALATVFAVLPLATQRWHLYVASAGFGIADALGCGLVMTLTADRAPKAFGAPFFGIMRMLADLGHVTGAAETAYLLRTVGFNVCCWVLATEGVLTALWGVCGVPSDPAPLETPMLTSRVGPASCTEHLEAPAEQRLYSSKQRDAKHYGTGM